MAVTDAFIATCRTRVLASAQLAAYNAAGALANDTRAERVAQWGRLFNADSRGTSVAVRTRAEIRGIVNAEADILAATAGTVVGREERETLAATLIADYTPDLPRPTSDAVELANIQRIIEQGYLQ